MFDEREFRWWYAMACSARQLRRPLAMVPGFNAFALRSATGPISMVAIAGDWCEFWGGLGFHCSDELRARICVIMNEIGPAFGRQIRTVVGKEIR